MNKNCTICSEDKTRMVKLKFGGRVVEVTQEQFDSFCRNVKSRYPIRLSWRERITGKYWGI